MEERKKILFVMPSLDAGGAEKSLVNLLNTLDFSRYRVDVLLFHKRGIFLASLPQSVRVLEPKGDFGIFSLGLSAAARTALRQGKFGLLSGRIAFALKHRLIKNPSRAEQACWKHVSRTMEKMPEAYDAAIGFLEKSSVYFVADKVSAAKKIAFIHNDYGELGMDPDFDREYFSRLDHIATVSAECAQVLEKTFPEFAAKIGVIHNIVSPAFIRSLSERGSAEDMAEGSLLSIGRLQQQKGFDLAIDALAILVENGFAGNWYVIGEGNLRQELQAAIARKNLEGRFVLLGLRENPYPYLKKAEIYVQPSRYEGKSIAIDEAKILGKPIVVTRFSTVADQISDGQNGLVAEMDAASVAEKIQAISDNAGLKARLSANLESENLGTEGEIARLYQLIENH
jgi:glycosyltransferase involved in cell wall biosynthesis